ncbi:MAG: peptide chain release factor N(5)-glutamine methyltransferase [bacterium]
MTSVEALSRARNSLHAARIEAAPQEARLVLCHLLGVSSTQLYGEPERKLTEAQELRLGEILRRRASREPLAYILNTCEFYGHEFYVDPRVLIPRPETELLVDLVRQSVKRRKRDKEDGVVSLADVGTGSGAIAVSLALALKELEIYATDISPSALDVARINLAQHSLADKVALLQGDLLEAIPEPVDVMVANLPYVSSRDMATLDPEIAAFEPWVALYGGADGLEHVAALLDRAATKLEPRAELLFEIGQGQAHAAKKAAARYLPRAAIDIVPDPAGIDRVVHAVLTH